MYLKAKTMPAMLTRLLKKKYNEKRCEVKTPLSERPSPDPRSAQPISPQCTPFTFDGLILPLLLFWFCIFPCSAISLSINAI